jgi:hypothetical protein
LEVKGDSEDFVPTFLSLDKKGQISKDVNKIIRDLKKDKKVGIHLKRTKIPNYYVRKHDYNAYFKVILPENWRLIYGIISIHRQKSALIMELFNHDDYNKRFGFKKK